MCFEGASRDQVSFDSNGNGLGAYDITVVNMETEEWEAIGTWISNTSNVLDLPANASFLNLNLTKLRMLWTKVFNSSTEPTSFCGQQCLPGYWMSSEERYKVFFFFNYSCIKSNHRFHTMDGGEGWDCGVSTISIIRNIFLCSVTFYPYISYLNQNI